jgi:hypothetical protein
MKKCPQCGRHYGEEIDFCLQDAAPLVWDAAPGAGDVPSYGGVPPLPPPQTQNPVPGGNSNILYLVVGILATALVALSAYIFLLRDTGKQSKITGSASPELAAPAAAPSPRVTAPPQPAAAPIPGPAGRWTGQIAYPSGSSFSAQVDILETGAGRVSGQIVWTLLKTSNPAKKDRVGVSATEFVQGTFDATGRILSLEGYNETDPDDIIIRDKYRLTISVDGRNMSGPSLGGKVPGKLSLRRP